MCLPLAVLGPILGGVAAGGASAVGSAIGSSNAAGAQAQSAQDSLNFAKEQYNQQRQDMSPWLGAGQSSLGELMRQMGAGSFDTQVNPQNIANDPGYQFRMSEGQKALDRSASARGMLNSGGAMKSMARYSQGAASDEFQNAWNRNQTENTGRFNRLANLAGIGQTASQNISAAGSQLGNAGQNAYGAIGNAQSAGAMGGANAFSGAMGTLGNAATFGGLYNAYSSGGGQQIPAQNSYGYPSPGNANAAGYSSQGPWW